MRFTRRVSSRSIPWSVSLPFIIFLEATFLFKEAHAHVRLLQRLGNSTTSVPQNIQIPGQQNPVKAPALPIIELSEGFINNSIKYTNQSFNHLARRDALLCSPDLECPDGSCCSKSGICGYGPTYCGAGNCTSNCLATAMCGRYSEGGKENCGMNLCCSFFGWCGTTEQHCGNPDPNGLTPCQAGFGLCKVVPPPSCGKGTGSTKGRKIGYYQASNVRSRVCNKITPQQIVTTGFTHLYFAFAKFDPTSYTMVPSDPGDVDLYSQFTALKTSTLKTWIAVGGYDFSDLGPTHTAWSDMASTAAGRAAFIASLKSFMSKYGFQGVDIDWEYPVAEKRGGKKADTQNLVSLVKEMRASFGTQYGISLALAPDYWYLRGFDAKAMESSVDWFGFMAYDLHGSWDTDVKTLGSLVRGQTDIRDISSDTLPLWFAGLNPAKINFGTAYYGRGYTLADPSCSHLLCPFKDASKPGSCTNFPGVMSLREIEQKIAVDNLTPLLLPDSMMKQITWGDQWIGYDDAETIKMKQDWADGQCFGGTMVWSVDFASGAGSGDTAPVTTDGSCGAKNGGTTCGNWATGGCCSASGWCGSGPDYCGNGCQSGSCTQGGQTTDGRCGAQGSNTFCGNWSLGSCCSSSGWCGSTDAHCGTGCQSGCSSKDGTCGAQNKHNVCPAGSCCSADGSCGTGNDFCGEGCQSGTCIATPVEPGNLVYIDPELWNDPDPEPTLQCSAPCTFVLPDLTLSAMTTISVPPATETLEEVWPLSTANGQTIYFTITTTITISIPPITTSLIPFSNIEVSSDDNTNTPLLWAWTSLEPPLVTRTDKIGPNPFTWTYAYGPFPTAPWSVKPLPGIEPPNGHVHKKKFHFHIGLPKLPCRHGCGHSCRHRCGPPGIKLPHLGGKGPKLPCLGPGCSSPGGGGGNGPNGGGPCIGDGCSNPGDPNFPPSGGGVPGGVPPGSQPPENCPEPSTVSSCLAVCLTTAPPPPPKDCSTTCFGIVGCDVTGTTTTVTTATGILAPFEIIEDEEWGFVDFGSMDAAYPRITSEIEAEFNSMLGGHNPYATLTKPELTTSIPPTHIISLSSTPRTVVPRATLAQGK